MKDDLQEEIDRIERALDLMHKGDISKAHELIVEVQLMLIYLKNHG